MVLTDEAEKDLRRIVREELDALLDAVLEGILATPWHVNLDTSGGRAEMIGCVTVARLKQEKR